MNKLDAKKITLILYHVMIATIIATNLHLDQWLLGWDGLYPELNIGLNLIRGLTAGWQEYYGTGLVGGHGFAATLPHTIIIGFLTFVLPQHLVRSFFIMLCYYLGGLGMLIVSQKIITTLFDADTDDASWYTGFVAAIYYLVNLGTIQTFYVPLEAFTVHFAAFPWLTYGVLLLFDKVTTKRIVFFSLISLFASMQGFIPAVFIAYASSLAIITTSHLLLHRRTIDSLRSFITIWACVIATNAYWLGSVIYFTLTSSGNYINAYNSIAATPEFIAKSIKYGTLADVAQLKGLLWQSNELGGPIMAPWLNNFQHPAVPIIGYIFFALAIVGILISLQRKRWPIALGFILSLLYFFANLAIDAPPFSWIIHLVQTLSPNLAQAFRTTFTKFSIGLAFHYSLFIGVGLYAISKHSKSHILPIIACGALIFYGLPVWQGHLIYEKLYTTPPDQYAHFMAYMNTLPDGRIADFPQDCAEGWYNELWGYFGSGFLWYGIRQPVMARAFDIWNAANENYYWELSTALRANNFADIASVFSKYNIRYVYFDQNIINCRSQKGLQASRDFLSYVQTSPDYRFLQSFSSEHSLPITLYERVPLKSGYIQTLTSAPNVLPKYTYNDRDPIFASSGGYISDDTKPVDVSASYRNIFSKRGQPLIQDVLEQIPLASYEQLNPSVSTEIPCSTSNYAHEKNFHTQITQQSFIRMIATNDQTCRTMTINQINTSYSYIIDVASRHITGEPLSLSVANKGRSAGMDILLPKHSELTQDYFLLPASFPAEIYYEITIKNTSHNRYTAINDIGDIHMYEIPNEVITALTQPSQIIHTEPEAIDVMQHPFAAFYQIQMPVRYSNQTLILNQSFETGWIAYDRSSGKFLKNHVLVNNWANGWMLNNAQITNTNDQIFIFFWPQLLEWMGILLLPVPLFYGFFLRNSRNLISN
jgi:hypothetical protein